MKGIKRTSPSSARAERAYGVKPEELTKTIEEAIDSLPRWTLEDRDGSSIRAVRESRLFQFKDDIAVSVSARGNGSEATFESASRVGKGDLGQNLRNLRDLTEAMDHKLF